MDPSLVLFLLFRFLLPVLLTIVSVLRFNCFSLCYLLIFFISPFLPTPKRGVSSVGAKVLLIIIIVLSSFFLLCQISYNIALASLKMDELANNCSLSNPMNQIGLHQLSGMSVHRALRILIPDVAILIAVACIFAYLRRVERHQYESLLASSAAGPEVAGPDSQPTTGLTVTESVAESVTVRDPVVAAAGMEPKNLQRQLIISTLYTISCAVCCMLAGIMSASILASGYLLVFMAMATLWATMRLSENRVSPYRIMLLIYTGIHVLLYYLYQFNTSQSILPDGSFTARLLGFHWLFQSRCSSPGEVIFNQKVRWTEYVSPPVTFLLFYVLALATRRAMDLRSMMVHERLMDDTGANYGTSDNNLAMREHHAVPDDGEKPFFLSLLTNVIRISYIVAFLAMMTWSIVYVSWLSFVLLLTACLIWIMPRSRLVCLYLSPLIVFYGSVLLLLQYIFAMDLKELPTEYNGVKLQTFGMMKFEQPVGVLTVQVGLMMAFWSTLRLYTTEKIVANRRSNAQRSHDAANRRLTRHTILRVDTVALFGTRENATYIYMNKWLRFLKQQFVKLWIIVTSLLMLIISTQQPVVAFRIVYMVLFIYFMFTFMVSYNFWRKQMLTFWWIVIAYSMLVLISIYTFQFQEVRKAWNSVMRNDTLRDLGLQKYQGSALFSGLLTPVVFLVVVIFQVHYFHAEFIRISAIDMRTNSRSAMDDSSAGSSVIAPSIISEDFMTDISSAVHILMAKVKLLLKKRYILWRIAEVHLDKIVTVFAAIAAVNTASALWLPLLLICTLALPFLKSPWVWNTYIFMWLGLMIIAKMVYQLPSLFTGVDIQPLNCSMINLTSDPKEDDTLFTMKNLTRWIGLEDPSDYRYDINFLLALVCFVIAHMVVHYHQMQYYTQNQISRPMRGIIFPNLEPSSVDQSFIAFIKFLFNHAFFKFGLEISFIVSLIGVAVRADGLAAFYLCLTMVYVFLPREACCRLWAGYCIVLAIGLMAEYIGYLGLPVTLCIEYSWTSYFAKIRHSNWIAYLSLPDYRYKTPVSYLVADFFRFLFACLQMRAFRLEKSENVMERGGGDNVPVLEDIIPQRDFRDFISMKGSFLDYVKHGIFMYFFYVSLFILFGAGLMSTSLLGLLYLISSFIFLWMGMNLYTRPRRQLVHIWNCVIAYNLIVILLKCALQILGCIYPADTFLKRNSWIPKLFTVQCLNDYPFQSSGIGQKTDQMTLANTMTWDVICFTALLIQRKVFVSELFSNIVLDIRVQQKFASRGAAIINSRLIYEVTVKKVKEAKMLARVRRKLEKIRLRRQTWGVPNFDEHYKVLRSGDARLFEHDSESDGEDSTMVTSQGNEHDPDTEEVFVDNASAPTEDPQGGSTSYAATDDEIEFRLRKRKSSAQHTRPLNSSEVRRAVVNPMVIINKVIDKGPSTALGEMNSPTDPSQDRKSHRSDTVRTEPSKSEPTTPMIEENELPPDQPTQKSQETESIGSESSEIIEDFHDEVDNLEEPEEEDNKGGCWADFKATCVIIWRLFINFIDWLIDKLNHITREYRSIRMTLEAERKLAKRKVKEEGAISALHVHSEDDESSSDDSDSNDEPSSYQSVTHAVVSVRNRTMDPKRWKREVQQQITQVEEAETEFKRHQSRFFLLVVAIGNLAGHYWEQLCYLLMVINHMYSASILSMIYPFLIFIWGMLSVPRPSKLFWSCVITYTMLLIIIKYTFQFPFEILTEIALMNSKKEQTCINLGLERSANIRNTTVDLVLLMAIFIHRGFLKANGLWRAVSDTHDEMLALAKRYGQHLGYVENRGDVVIDARREPATSNAPDISITAPDSTKYERSGQHFYEKPLVNIKRFFEKMVDPLFNVRVDVYATMFFCEFIGMMTLVFGYSYFVPDEGSDENVTDYISQSKIPIPFLVMCLIQFIIIIVDRAIFLQKLVVGKLVFQIIMMITVHIWIFIALPCYTNTKFRDNTPAMIFYFLKCIYFGLSAYQIRSGYPVRVLGNFLTKSYNYVNLFLYKGFVVVPFLMDLRCVMDWIWTETTLGLYHWDQMEHIYSIIYIVKCWHYSEDIMPTPRGQRRGKCAKYGLGGLVVALIILAIWLPMMVFSILGATAQPNLPTQCEASISIGGFTPIYVATAQSSQLQSISKETYDKLKASYTDEKARSVLNRFEYKDVKIVRMDENSSVIWSITPPGQSSLMHQLNSSISMEFSLSCKRKAMDVQTSVSGLFKHPLNDTERLELIHSIGANLTKAQEARIHQVFPRYVILNKNSIENDKTLSPENEWINLSAYREMSRSVQWWRIQEVDFDNRSEEYFNFNNLKQPYMVTLNERAYKTNFVTNFFAGYGVIGLYVVFVIWFANLIRRVLFCSDSLRFDDMPYVDRILHLCHDIYLVRAHKDWELEEELYSKLDYLWRSPETMIKYSKPKTD